MAINLSDHVMPVVCANVTKTYRPRWRPGHGRVAATERVSFKVRRGSILGLVGPNGSGKTTLLGLVAGLLKPDVGAVWICGCPARSRPARQCLALVPESPSFLKTYSGVEALRYHGALLGLSRTELAERVRSVRKELDLDSRFERAIKTFSLGMKQRLAVGMAVMAEPAVLLLDEPANGLDPLGVHALRGLLLRLAAEGVSVIISSHQLSELEKLTSQFLFLNQGRLVSSDMVKRGASDGYTLRIEFLPLPDAVQNVQKIAWTSLGRTATSATFPVKDDADAAALIVACVHAGVRVTQVMREKDSIEAAFMEMSSGG